MHESTPRFRSGRRRLNRSSQISWSRRGDLRPLRVSGRTCTNALEAQDVDTRAPCRQGLYRFDKICSSNFYEFHPSIWSRFDIEKIHWHRVFLPILMRTCGFVKATIVPMARAALAFVILLTNTGVSRQ